MNIGRGVELSSAVFEDTSLPDVHLRNAKLHKAELTNTSMERGKLYGLQLHGARISGGSFKDADLETAELARAVSESSDCAKAQPCSMARALTVSLAGGNSRTIKMLPGG